MHLTSFCPSEWRNFQGLPEPWYWFCCVPRTCFISTKPGNVIMELNFIEGPWSGAAFVWKIRIPLCLWKTEYVRVKDGRYFSEIYMQKYIWEKAGASFYDTPVFFLYSWLLTIELRIHGKGFKRTVWKAWTRFCHRCFYNTISWDGRNRSPGSPHNRIHRRIFLFSYFSPYWR